MKLIISVGVCVVFLLNISEIVEANTEKSSLATPNESPTATTKTKRGILNYGYGYSGPHGLTYNLPSAAAYPALAFPPARPWIGTPYGVARIPSIYHNILPSPALHHHHHIEPALQPTQYALSHGGATVTSYNVNLPRYPIYFNKPNIEIPIGLPSFPRPLNPSVFLPKPIVPVAVSAFSNRIPITVNKQLPSPPLSFLPSIPSPTIYPIGSIQPQFIPIPLPSQPPTIHSFPATITPPTPTITTSTATTPNVPLPGTHFVTHHIQPDQWRPIIVTQNPTITPTTPKTTVTINRPSISLLPPYGNNGGDNTQHQAQIELQGYDDEFISNQNQLYQPPQQQQQQVNQLYFSPNVESIEINGQRHHISDQDYIQGTFLFFHSHRI